MFNILVADVPDNRTFSFVNVKMLTVSWHREIISAKLTLTVTTFAFVGQGEVARYSMPIMIIPLSIWNICLLIINYDF